MKVSVDLELCSGHARCSAVAPDIFDTDPMEGKAVVLRVHVPPELAASALRGARACPERAITVADDVPGATLWPPS